MGGGVPSAWINDKSGHATIEDTVFTPSSPLTISASHKFLFTAPTITARGVPIFSNLRETFFDTLFPAQKDDFYRGQLTFKSTVPPGTNHFVSLLIESGGVPVLEDLEAYLMPPQMVQPFVFTAGIAVTEFIFENGLDVFLIPSVEVDIFDVRLTWNKSFNIGLR